MDFWPPKNYVSTLPDESINTPNPLEPAYADMQDLVNACCPNPSESLAAKYSLGGDSEAILELIYLEFVMLRERGRQPCVEQFQARFPDLSREICSLLEVDSVIGVGMESGAMATPGSSSEVRHELLVFDGAPRVLGQYRLLEVIGRGGMGVVYRAVQERLNRIVAIKTLNILASLDQSSRDRFQSEASLAAQLQHANIVQVYEISSHAGVPFYSMELVAGGTLAKVLKEGPLKAETAAQLALWLSRAVAYAHAHGVIHRDLKPANVLLARSERLDASLLPAAADSSDGPGSSSLRRVEPKIADFGLAKQIDCTQGMTASGTMLGTPSFMAPEQVVASSSVGAPCDIYALGAILYNMLSGQPPFLSSNAMETLRQVREKDPIPLRYLQPNTPRDLETICFKCLRKNPASRYATADELAADLERYIGGLPITARPSSGVERLFKWTRRHPSLAGLLLSACIALVAITWLWRGAEGSRRAEELARQRTEQSLYAHSISMLYSQYRLNHISENRVREKLDDSLPGVRGWEWHYMRGLCDQAIWESPPKKQTITAAALSPDGRYAALGCGKWGYDSDQVIEVWDIWENKLKWCLQGHPKCQVCCVQFSPDGKYLASSAIVWRNSKTPGGVLLWDLSTGLLGKNVANINSDVIRFSQDGKSLYIGGMDGMIRENSCDTAEELRTLKGLSGMILSMQFSPDFKKLVATGRNNNWGVFDEQSGKADWILRNQGDVRELCWSSDGKELSVGRYDGQLRTFRYDPMRPVLLRTERFLARTNLAASPDGMWRAKAVFGKNIEVRDERTDHLIGSFSGHGGDVRELAFDNSCRLMISAGGDGIARVWDLSNQRTAFRTGNLPLGCAASSIANHPLVHRFALGTKQNPSRSGQFKPIIEIRDSHSQRPLLSLSGHSDELTYVAYRADGQQLISASRDMSVRLWNPESGKELAALKGHEAAVILADFIEGGSQAISVDEKGVIILWDTEGYRMVSQWFTDQPVDLAAVHTRRKLLATAQKSGEVLLWDLATQTSRIRQLPSDAIACIAFNSQGNYLAIAGDKQDIDLWDVDQLFEMDSSARPQKRLRGSSLATTHLGFSPDDTRLCAVGRDDMVRIYDTQLGNELLSLESGETGNEHLVSFSADGRQILRAAGVKILTWNILDPIKNRPMSEACSPQAQIRWHQSRLAAATSVNQLESALYHSRALIHLEPDNRDGYCRAAMIRMRMNDWEGAEADFQQGIELSSSILNRSKYAITLLRLGKLSEYTKHCRLLTISAHMSNSMGMQMAARTIALAPDADLDVDSLVRLVEKVQSKSPEPMFSNTLALLQYRCGRTDDAIQSALQSLKADQQASVPMDWMVIALAQAEKTRNQNTNQQEGPSEIHPTVMRYARLVVQWCENQVSLIALGGEPSKNLSMAREELPILYAELQEIVGGNSIPTLLLR
jgi:eukaryotic-like serine/threonine-protein kinase